MDEEKHYVGSDLCMRMEGGADLITAKRRIIQRTRSTYMCNLHPNSRLLSTYPHIRTDLPGEKGKGIIMARDQTRHWGGGGGGG